MSLLHNLKNGAVRLFFGVAVAVLVTGCSMTRPASWQAPQPSAANVADLKNLSAPYAQAAMTAYSRGDCAESRRALQAAFSVFDASAYRTGDERVAFLDAHHPIPSRASYHDLLRGCDLVAADLVEAPRPVTQRAETPAPRPTAEEIPPVDPHANLTYFVEVELNRLLEQTEGSRQFVPSPGFVAEIERYIVRYQTDANYRAFFERALNRARKFMPLLAPHFEEKGLPAALILGVGVQESGFNPTARSYASAQGTFQFMAATARDYDLTVNRSVDERNAPFKAGLAARDYLIDLIRQFDDLTLALAAYNGGPGRVSRAKATLGGGDDLSFWDIAQRVPNFPTETKHYVPQVLAAAIAGRAENVTRLGFAVDPEIDPNTYRTVLVPQQASLSHLAEAADLTVAALLAYNPDLAPDATMTPRGVVDYPLFVPVGSELQIQGALRELRLAANHSPSPPVRTAHTRNPAQGGGGQGGLYVRYQVQSGNTLSSIARWFGKSMNEIKGWNPYLNQRGLQVGDVVYIRQLPRDWKKHTHNVQRGETLSSIARKYGVSVANLRAWNGLRSDTLRAGQSLVVYARSTPTRRS